MGLRSGNGGSHKHMLIYRRLFELQNGYLLSCKYVTTPSTCTVILSLTTSFWRVGTRPARY